MTKIQWILLLVFLLAAGVAAVITILLRRKRQRNTEKPETMDNLTDFHCHILPGVDDGSEDMDMTLEMLDLSYAQGVRRIIATPHYHRGHVENEPEKLREVLKKVQEKAAKKYPDLEIRLGNEVFYSDGVIELLRQGKILPLGDGENSRYLLVEFSPDDSFSRLQDAVSQVTRMGYRPVIAHVERYQCMYRQKDRFEELQRQGALFQVNYNQVRENRWLFQHDFVDLLATDCHNTEERAPKIEENLKALFAFCSREQIEKILKTNPDRIWFSGKTSL